MEEYILSLTNLPRRKLEEVRKMKQDWFMFAEEAMSYGLVDELIESKRNKYNK
ncbi:MAG: ATP-dependent Clp protease proteolytic subunit [Psychrobacillus sp.]